MPEAAAAVGGTAAVPGAAAAAVGGTAVAPEAAAARVTTAAGSSIAIVASCGIFTRRVDLDLNFIGSKFFPLGRPRPQNLDLF